MLIAFPALVALGFNWRSWIYFGLGGFPGAVLLGALNYELYGKIFTTGYGDISSILKWEFVPLSLDAYKLYLPLELTPLVILTIGLLLPSLWRRTPLIFLVTSIWISTFFIFYAFYLFTHETWWHMRFLLPTFPAILVVICITLRDISIELDNKKRSVVLLICAIFVFFWQVSSSTTLGSLNSGKSDIIYLKTMEKAKELLPSDSIILAMQVSGTLTYYTNFPIVRWDTISSNDLQKIELAADKAKRPIYAILFPFELEQIQLSKEWIKTEDVDFVTIWKRNP
jgi:hypothetical protein